MGEIIDLRIKFDAIRHKNSFSDVKIYLNKIKKNAFVFCVSDTSDDINIR